MIDLYFKYDIKMLRCFLLLFLVVLCHIGKAQTTGEEWINYNQTYFKLSVAEEGIYRITYSDLQNAGFPVNQVDPRRIQLFHRGKEQAIFIQGQGDARFDPQDFIEFYGQRNDGTQDRDLYIPSNAQPHNYYNLYSDTTAYFLTWRLNQETGKRMSFFSEVNVTNKPAETYHWDEKLQLNVEQYSGGRLYPEGGSNAVISHSHFDFGEGWTGLQRTKGQQIDYTLTNIAHRHTTGPRPTLEVLLAGRNNRRHNITIHVGPSTASLRVLENVQFDFYNIHKLTKEIQWSDISATGNLVVRMVVNGFSDSPADAASVSFIRLQVPQQFNMQGQTQKVFSLIPNTSGSSYVEISNAPAQYGVFNVTDKDNPQRIGSTIVGGNVAAIIPNTTLGRRLFVVGQTGLKTVPSIKRVGFRRITPASHNYLIVSHRSLMRPHSGDPNPVKSYAAYRASVAGGRYDTLVMEVRQLYDQFSYGEVSPIAIRRFASYMLNGGDPKALLFVGKSLTVNHNFYRRDPSTVTIKDLVPTAGLPGSDILFTAGLKNGSSYEAAIPTGRLSFNKPEQVVAYLNKVKEMEALPYNDLWRKNLVHLSGGVNLVELSAFRRNVDGFKAIAENHFFGAKVTTLSKRTQNAVEFINISEEVNRGVNLITFFGHSAPTIADIDIGFVSNDALGYRNKSRYPMILVNGCQAGNIFGNVFTIGEDWIAASNRGALGFFAHSSEGLTGNLRLYSNAFYNTAYGDSAFISKSVGQIQIETSKRYLSTSGISPSSVTQVQQLVFQGDPALSVFGAAKPDYETNDNQLSIVSLNGSPVNALSDSFAIAVIVRNFGRTSYDSLKIGLTRTLGNGQVIQYDPVLYPPVLHKDTLYFNVNNQNLSSFGNNRFEIFLDYGNHIQELNENNNIGRLEYFIPLSGTVNLFPVNYGIVNQLNVELMAQSADLLSPERDFLFELDTLHTFKSPFKKQTKIKAKLLAKWEQELIHGMNGDSLVYYWRTKYADPLPGEDTAWAKSSFIYIKDGKEGWAQARFAQMKENYTVGMVPDNMKRKWEFKEIEKNVQVTTYGSSHPDFNFRHIQLVIEGVSYIFDSNIDGGARLCTNNTINAVAFKNQTLEPYLVQASDIINRRSCGRTPQVVNNFTKSEIETSLLLNQYLDLVQPGEYVLIFSIGEVTYQSWPASLKDKLMQVGASSITLNALQNGHPYILLGKKGMGPGEAIEIVAEGASGVPANQQEIDLMEKIKARLSKGYMITSRIGPAANWETFYNSVKGKGFTEKVEFDIVGLDAQGKETMLYYRKDAKQIDISQINAAQFPYIKLKVYFEDNESFDPAKLLHWMVTYEGVPEGILMVNDHKEGVKLKNERMEGQELQLSFTFQNISSRPFKDSIKVERSVFNKSSRKNTVKTFNLKPLPPGAKVDFNVKVETIDKVGENDLKVFVNPYIQPELYYNNNLIQLHDFVKVKRNNVHPVLDVAFDGVYIMDGDIVSPSPVISIKLKESNNQVLQKKDTVGVDIFLKAPCETCNFQQVYFTNPRVHYRPASDTESFSVEYHPEHLEDGVYTLQLQAKDASGNKSGIEPYTIRFEVVNESKITHFYPYPNPFSTRTQFVFTLTGSEIPDQIKIQIMTVTGKIVREITQDELGPIRIGHNRSQYAWDGRDEYGDQLANGVYLYRVIVRSRGQIVERRETSADKAFKKDFGKIYLLR
jgi:hypothetical protein